MTQIPTPALPAERGETVNNIVRDLRECDRPEKHDVDTIEVRVDAPAPSMVGDAKGGA